MANLEQFANKHQALMTIVGVIVATAVSVTVYALTTFETKEEVRLALDNNEKVNTAISVNIEKRLDRIENKIDDLIASKQNK